MIQAFWITADELKQPLPDPPKTELILFENQLRCGPNAPLAVYRDGRWKCDETDFSILRIESPVLLQFREGSTLSDPAGPFCPVMIANGIVCASPQEAVVAQISPSERSWLAVPARRAWQEMLIREAEPDE